MNSVLKRWRKNYIRISIIIIGITLGILSISIGLSFFEDGINFSKEMSSGDSKVNESLIYSRGNNEDISMVLNNIALDLNKNYQVSIGSITYPMDRNVPLSDCPSIVPVIYSKTIKWKPNLIYGRYMSMEESLTDKKVAVIGYEVYKYFFKDQEFSSDMKLDIYGVEYSILGVVGRTKRYTPQNFQIEIPYKNYFSFYEEEPDLDNIPITVRGENDLDLEYLKENNLRLISKPVYENDVKIPLKLVMLIGGLILIVTIINESNLFSFWLLSIRKEIAIKKALGATNMMIIFDIFKEILTLSVVSIILALIFQYIICQKLSVMLSQYELNITFMNLLISIVLAITISIFSSIIPYKIIFSTNPCVELKK